MSAATLTAKELPHGTTTRVIKKAESNITTWLGDLVTGAGSSPSHIIITGILGVVPGVGQAMDIRDLVLGIIAISRTPTAIAVWVDLVITLIGCIPAVGDALKVGFKLMKRGHNFGRILEGVSPKLHGNVEKFMRDVNWTMLANESKGLFKKTIAAFIDGLDSWMVKAVAGGTGVRQIIGELRTIEKNAPKMIDDAFAELKQLHAKMMSHELPGNTAAASVPTARVGKVVDEGTDASTKQIAKGARDEAKLLAKRNNDVKTPRAQTNSTNTSTKKSGKEKKRNWKSGVPAEHITDYFVKRKHVTFVKVNNGGKLTEENSTPHTGIDHLWANDRNPIKPYVVGETKSRVFDSLTLIAALPAALAEKFAVLRSQEASNPTPSGQPNTFQNAGRDAHADQVVRIKESSKREQNIRASVNPPGKDKHGNPTGLATQMSHEWIVTAIDSENMTTAGFRLKRLLRERELNGIINTTTGYPYNRWISLVTGRQLAKHQKSKGAAHHVQFIIDLPENILKD
ncbi:hypothetical protein ACFFTM_23385 [Pseudoduganella plicata]|uniref:Uncharacterized protein n=1 Tax=Pseudoduganella plicata TaxID=321984 RepID=A0A4P7BG62_9BURK|nr:hypothetical protein [Pseudoduganella plicata]QBQ37694.1 hypothetical protein E1742_17070 [Pseudoduganella plicata]GGZ11713.1 hypothetical protein GCM10007388_51240 [Pseudoduganella plicata]